MGIKKILGVSRKTFFNPRAWLGFDLLKSHTLAIWDFIALTLKTKQATAATKESFAEAMTRLEVKEGELPAIMKRYLTFAYFFLILAILDIAYAGYLLVRHHSIASFIIASSTVVFLLVQAFKYHFWQFQIKQRKLGCTFAEWRSGKTTTIKSPEDQP